MIANWIIFISAIEFFLNPIACCQDGTNGTPKGIDVSAYQGNVDWKSVKVNGISFAYIKATEGTEYVNSYFAQQYEGSYSVGLIRGSYHFARPDIGSGNVQADYFVDHGGGWSPDGQTLPGVLDIEYNPYGPICYGLSHGDMVNWIQSFSDEYYSRTQRYPVIYSTLDWWTTCTGNSGALGNNNPLWIARYSTSPGPMPAGWQYETFWRYTDNAEPNPGNGDIFHGDYDHLKKFASQ